MDQPTNHLLGTIIGGYRLEELLGRGATTTVYHARAQQPCVITELTVTVISLPESFSPQMRARFMQRFQRITDQLAAVRHPLLHSLYGSGEYKGNPYLFTPDMRGETLKTYLAQYSRCTPEDALRLISPIVQAFKHLHSHGLSYRFFDPSNILLMNNNVVQIIGLGLAQILCLSGLQDEKPAIVSQANIEHSPDHLRSIDGSFLGVPFYLAPEVLLNGEASPRSDIYSLGVLIFEMLSGQLPFFSQDYVEVVRKSLLEPVPSLRSVVPGCSEALERLVLRAMQRDPERRFQNVDEFLAVFTSLVRQNGRPPTTSGPKRVTVLEDPTIPRYALERLSGHSAPITHEPLPLLPPKEKVVSPSFAAPPPPSLEELLVSPKADLSYELPNPFGEQPKPSTPPPPPRAQQPQPQPQQKAPARQQMPSNPTPPSPREEVQQPEPSSELPRYSLSQATMFSGMSGVFSRDDLVEKEPDSLSQATMFSGMSGVFSRDDLVEKEPEPKPPVAPPKPPKQASAPPMGSPWEYIDVTGENDQPWWENLQLSDDSPSAPMSYKALEGNLFSDPVPDGEAPTGKAPNVRTPQKKEQRQAGEENPLGEFGAAPRENKQPLAENTKKADRSTLLPARSVSRPPETPAAPSGEWGNVDTQNSGLPPGVLEAQGWSLPSGAPPLEQLQLAMAAPTENGKQKKKKKTKEKPVDKAASEKPEAPIKKRPEKATGGMRPANMLFDYRLVLVLVGLIMVTFLGAHPFVQPKLPLPPMPTAIPTAPAPELGGMCIATPAQMKYLSSNGSTDPAADWTSVGGSKADYVNAQACAAKFLATYLTFDIADAKSLESSVYMLSVGAKKRFYSHDSSLSVDYMDSIWRASAQRHHLSQTTQVALPGLVHVLRNSNQFLAWMIVHYKVQKKTDAGTQTTEYDSTVLLNKVLAVSTSTGTGWQVSAWHSGSINFPPPNPI